MHGKWLLFISLAAVACAAPQGDIPVKVIYDKEITHKLYVRNLDKKIEEDVVEHNAKEETLVGNVPEQVREFVPKIITPDDEPARSQEEVKEADVEPQEQGVIKTLEEKQKDVSEIAPKEVESKPEVYINALRNHDEKIQLSPNEVNDAVRHLPHDVEEIEKETLVDNVSEQSKVVRPDDALALEVQTQEPQGDKLFDRIQDIISSGVQRIKDDVKQTQEIVQPEVWTSFNTGVTGFLDDVKNKYSLRQNNNSSILDQFQNFASGFISQLNGQNQNPSQDANQQPGFPQNIAQAFQNGFNQIQQSLGATFSTQQPSTVLGDAGSGTSNPLQGFVQQAQNAFNNFINPSQNPSDSASTNPIQNFQNSIGQAISGLNPFQNRPGAAGDESSTQGGPLQAFQNALSNLNPFQATTAKPADSSSANPIPSIPAIPTIPSLTNLPGVPNIPIPSNPLGGNNPIQSGIQQVTGALGNNPLGLGGTNPISGLATGGNPVEGITQQVTNALGNNPIAGGNNPLQGITDQLQGGSNPGQQIAQQLGTLVPGNPLQTGNNPLQGAAQQVTNAITSNIPSS